MAHKPVYRRVLVELYLRYVPRLVERTRHGTDEVKKAARAELDRIGAHGLQPLLEALRDEKDVASSAIAVAGARPPRQQGRRRAARPHGAPGAAEGSARTSARCRRRSIARSASTRWSPPAGSAMPTCSTTCCRSWITSEVAMREAATFTLGRSGDKRAVPPLLKALDDRRPSGADARVPRASRRSTIRASALR